MNTAALCAWLTPLVMAQLPAESVSWLQDTLSAQLSERDFLAAFSRVPRLSGKAHLALTQAQALEAKALHAGFSPERWTLAQATRALLLARAPHHSSDDYGALLHRLSATADLGELVALYSGLPVLPYPETHLSWATDGIRSTITDVFDAVALHNPYPHDFLPPEAWNQMVLKAVFNARPLYQIYGLDNRRNPTLARMLLDYAHERWAAGRSLTPEVWRLVSPYFTPESLENLRPLLRSPEPLQVQAAALALSESTLPAAEQLLAQHPAARQTLSHESVTWHRIGEQAYLL
ncbi:hypothetical protein E5K00_18895 [Hymenobacter aquaticus]|uniref:EboA domain-containing protein n=1 Tax=Hymenobacter aquaticus TaxID=1867101 RepID=A0A4Z0PZI5_9BACT|nr:EboA domain-containing protein [Hymenobacter aquaticus]TGE22313.1 hypothetical protein E5K00_18895 [Hymenobacter aquaticus]